MTWLGLAAGFGALLLCGCVERTLTIRSNPTGALVYMNDQEIGRTPLTRQFVWYGYYDVQVRREGYEPLKTTTAVIAPWWQWVPIDLLAELLPLRLNDQHTVQYALRPQSESQNDPENIVDRGERLGEKLEFGQGDSTRPTPQNPKTSPKPRSPSRPTTP